MSAPLSGDILIYIDGQLVRDITVPQSDYTLYEIDLSEYDSDIESEIVVVNEANTVYASGSSYGQNGRLYFAGYENYVLSGTDLSFVPIILTSLLILAFVFSCINVFRR